MLTKDTAKKLYQNDFPIPNTKEQGVLIDGCYYPSTNELIEEVCQHTTHLSMHRNNSSHEWNVGDAQQQLHGSNLNELLAQLWLIVVKK